jgi:DNA-binding CsgD family transcriptional regulator
MGYAIHAQSILAICWGDMGTAEALTEQGLRVLGEHDELADLRLVLLANRVSGLARTDRLQESLRTAREAISLAERVGNHRRTMLQLHASQILEVCGEWDDALAELESIGELTVASGAVRRHAVWAVIACHRDDRPTLARHLSSIERYGQGGFPERDILFTLRALVAERTGGPAAAIESLRDLLDPAEASNVDPESHLPLLVSYAFAIDDRTTVRAGADACADYAQREPTPSRLGAAAHCEGLAEGDPALLRSAADQLRAIPRPLPAAHALADAANLHARRGELEAARTAHREAIELYEMLGAAWDIRRVDAQLRAHGIRRGVPGSRRRAGTGWAALTATEHQVAVLVGDGLSNAEIARGLYMSRRTVECHVSRIMEKLEVQGRFGIAQETMRNRSEPGFPEQRARRRW